MFPLIALAISATAKAQTTRPSADNPGVWRKTDGRLRSMMSSTATRLRHLEMDRPLLSRDERMPTMSWSITPSTGYQVKDGILSLYRPASAARKNGGSKNRGNALRLGNDRRLRAKFAQQFGWFEIRTQIPKGKRILAGVLALAGKAQNGLRKSIFWRSLATILQRYISRLIGRNDRDKHDQDGRTTGKCPDFSAGFHTFAVDWGTPD